MRLESGTRISAVSSYACVHMCFFSIGMPLNIRLWIQGLWIDVGKTIINHRFWNGLYHQFMVIWGMVYGIVLPTLDN